MKKIVIVPVFCEAHLVRFQIPNIIDTIDPDVIIYNEGMFPAGPESTTDMATDFKDKYTLDGKRGFDYLELKPLLARMQSIGFNFGGENEDNKGNYLAFYMRFLWYLVVFCF